MVIFLPNFTRGMGSSWSDGVWSRVCRGSSCTEAQGWQGRSYRRRTEPSRGLPLRPCLLFSTCFRRATRRACRSRCSVPWCVLWLPALPLGTRRCSSSPATVPLRHGSCPPPWVSFSGADGSGTAPQPERCRRSKGRMSSSCPRYARAAFFSSASRSPIQRFITACLVTA